MLVNDVFGQKGFVYTDLEYLNRVLDRTTTTMYISNRFIKSIFSYGGRHGLTPSVKPYLEELMGL